MNLFLLSATGSDPSTWSVIKNVFGWLWDEICSAVAIGVDAVTLIGLSGDVIDPVIFSLPSAVASCISLCILVSFIGIVGRLLLGGGKH